MGKLTLFILVALAGYRSNEWSGRQPYPATFSPHEPNQHLKNLHFASTWKLGPWFSQETEYLLDSNWWSILKTNVEIGDLKSDISAEILFTFRHKTGTDLSNICSAEVFIYWSTQSKEKRCAYKCTKTQYRLTGQVFFFYLILFTLNCVITVHWC